MWGVRSEAPTEQVSESLKRRMGKIGCEVGWDNVDREIEKKDRGKIILLFFSFYYVFFFIT